jgi:LemA protein
MTMHRFDAYRVVAMSVAAVSLSGCSHNDFVGQEKAVKAEWAQVQNELQRRNDLIPDLVEKVKGYAPHDQSVFQAVADSRARLAGARTPGETIAAANQQSTALEPLLAVVENYPQLKANDAFNRVRRELAAAETRVAIERMRYNARVQQYNTSRRQLRGVLTAILLNFQDYPFFLVEVPATSREVPKVESLKADEVLRKGTSGDSSR